MDIGRTDGVRGPGRIEGKPVEHTRATPMQPAGVPDRVDISHVGRLVSETLSMPTIRQEKIAELQKQINAGTYQTDERLIGAIEKFMDEMAGR